MLFCGPCRQVGVRTTFLQPLRAGLGENHISTAPADGSAWEPHFCSPCRRVWVRLTFGCEVLEKHILECMRTEVQMESTGLSGFFEKPLGSFCTNWNLASFLNFISGFGFSLTHFRWVSEASPLKGVSRECALVRHERQDTQTRQH